MTHFYGFLPTTSSNATQASAALLCNLAALGNLCLPNAYSRAAGSRPFKNGFRNHDWSRALALRAFGARLESARILVSYRPLVHEELARLRGLLLVKRAVLELSRYG